MSLTTAQRQHVERRLGEERSRALALINRIVSERTHDSGRQESGDLSVVPIHSADLGTDRQDEDLDFSNVTRASAELAEIDAALERLYASPAAFGLCEETGEQISFKRLDMIPWARTCN